MQRGRIEGADSRIDPRAVVQVRVVLFGISEEHTKVEGTTRNLSATGALCEVPIPPLLGSPLRVQIDLTNDAGDPHPVVIQVLVLRVEGRDPCLVALHFVEPPQRIQNDIKRYVFSRLPTDE